MDFRRSRGVLATSALPCPGIITHVFPPDAWRVLCEFSVGLRTQYSELRVTELEAGGSEDRDHGI